MISNQKCFEKDYYLRILKQKEHKVFLRICCLVFASFILTLCEKDTVLPDVSEGTAAPYAALESTIRSKYDNYSVFRWDEYTRLLDTLKNEKFVVLPMNEMRNTYDNSKVIVGLRHDVDFNPFKALEMAKIEELNGFRATYYMLATAEYSGKISSTGLVRPAGYDYLVREISNTGAEIGIHNDLLAVQVLHKLDPFEFNKEELNFYGSLNIPVYGTSSHGSPFAKATVPNYQVFSDFAKSDSAVYQSVKFPLGLHSLEQFGYMYEAYFVNFGIYYSDSGGKWNDPEGLNGILKKLQSSKPGDRIQILVHPDWWGKLKP